MTDTGHRTDAGDGTCRRCDAELLWAWLVGKRTRVPLDPTPATPEDLRAGRRLAVSRDHLGRLRARELELGERPGPGERPGVHHLDTCRVLVEAREAAASLRQARRAAPSFHDTEALAEARGRALAELVDGEHGDGRPAKRGRR